MPSPLNAGPPLEPLATAVGHHTTVVVDAARSGRELTVDCWFPAGVDGTTDAGALVEYELLPGISFTAAAITDASVRPGPHPLLVWSHGRVGTRTSYVMLCEALAGRGYVVVAADHPGDTLFDWMTGTAVDDATNERQRVADLEHVVAAAYGGEVLAGVELDAFAVAGHSYGAWSAYAYGGSEAPDPRLAAVAGLQPFTRSLPRRVLERVAVPALVVAGHADQTTPPREDADRASAALGHALRVDITAAGHQACSDVGLYLELAPQVNGLPDLVRDFIAGMSDQVTGTAGDPWRPTVGLNLAALGGFLDHSLGRDPARALDELERVAASPGVSVGAHR